MVFSLTVHLLLLVTYDTFEFCLSRAAECIMQWKIYSWTLIRTYSCLWRLMIVSKLEATSCPKLTGCWLPYLFGVFPGSVWEGSGTSHSPWKSYPPEWRRNLNDFIFMKEVYTCLGLTSHWIHFTVNQSFTVSDMCILLLFQFSISLYWYSWWR